MRACLVVGLFLGGVAGAQVGVRTVAAGDASGAATGAVTGVMLSDLHFDPFRDAAKVTRLDAAPVGEWEAILRSAGVGGAG